MRIQYQKGGNYFSAMGLSAQIRDFLRACMNLRDTSSKFKDLSYEQQMAFRTFVDGLPKDAIGEGDNGQSYR